LTVRDEHRQWHRLDRLPLGGPPCP
jgi:hypothetical protein